jgi:hypothetical protein
MALRICKLSVKCGLLQTIKLTNSKDGITPVKELCPCRGDQYYRHNGFIMYRLHSKLACLSKPEDATILQNLTISRKLRVRTVLSNLPQVKSS